MLKTKRIKFFIALAIIVSLLFPYACPVLAADDTPVGHIMLDSTDGSDYTDLVETTFYTGTHHMIYIYEGNTTNSDIIVDNEIYCLQSAKRAPGYEGMKDYLDYQIVFGTNPENNENLSAYITYIAQSIALENMSPQTPRANVPNSAITENTAAAKLNYNKIAWILQNMYYTTREDFIDVVFKTIPNAPANTDLINSRPNVNESGKIGIKDVLSKADIKTVAQLAIWYYSDSNIFKKQNVVIDLETIDAATAVEFGLIANASDTEGLNAIHDEARALKAGVGFKYSPSKENYNQITKNDSVFKTAYIMNFNDPDEIIRKTSWKPLQKNYLDAILSNILINAEKHKDSVESGEVIVPIKIENSTAPIAEFVEADNQYKIGKYKFKYNKNGASASDVDDSAFDVNLIFSKIENGNKTEVEVPAEKWSVKVGNETKTLKEAVKSGNEFYIYVDKSVVDDGVKQFDLTINYLKPTLTTLNLYVPTDVDYQQAAKVVRTFTPDDNVTVTIAKGDLSLRKFITKVNDTTLTGNDARTPDVDASELYNNLDTTAKYVHKKDAVKVKPGDKVTYTLKVYNEGSVDAELTKIADIIPDGLEFVAEDNDSKWSYKAVEGVDKVSGVAVYTFAQPVNISARPATYDANATDDGLASTSATIVLRVKEDAEAGNLLNLAEILETNNVDDRDSQVGSLVEVTGEGENQQVTIKQTTIDILNQSDYTGSSEEDGYFKGDQDDDDFEKVLVEVEDKVHDLNLKKYVSKINGKAPEVSREPKVDVTPLVNKTATDAKYTSEDKALKVKQGDIVEYTIKVYNEGEYDAYAEVVSDIIPEGLGVIVNHKTNIDNLWNISVTEENRVALKDIPNADKNINVSSDIKDATSIDDVYAVKGKAIIKSTGLSSEVPDTNKISKFSYTEGMTIAQANEQLKNNAKELKVVCVVLDENLVANHYRNVAEISKDSTVAPDGTINKETNPDGTPNPNYVKDRDSTPGNVENGGKEGEDDDDDENLTVEIYDLALQKFITKVDDEEVKGREPTITESNGKIQYSHTTDPLPVANGQLVEYTINVYNEGKTAAYAAEIADTIPNGLEFVEDNETNKKYGWYLADKDGNKTSTLSLAKTVRTTYLSKEESEKRDEDNLLQPYPYNGGIDCRPVKIVFRVVETDLKETTTTEERIIKNIAEITKETDKDGTPVKDIDSTPDNWDETEDDIDIEKIYVKFFDLELTKNLKKVIVTTNGKTTEYDVNEDQLFKVEINKKYLNSTIVKFVYDITVYNKGEIDGYATEVKDYIPEGLEFKPEDNPGWYTLEDGAVGTAALADTLLPAGTGVASVEITLEWINSDTNLGKKTNVAEINAHKNKYNSKDIDSTPGNKVPDEDDIDDAPVILGISTGKTQSYTGLIVAVAVIMTSGVVLIKKYVL